VFLSRSQPVETDDLLKIYANRPYGNVFEPFRRVAGCLQTVFDAAQIIVVLIHGRCIDAPSVASLV
jgi:hypothetical protein